MVITWPLNTPFLFVLLGLILWLATWPPSAGKLNELGRVMFLIAFAVWLGLFH